MRIGTYVARTLNARDLVGTGWDIRRGRCGNLDLLEGAVEAALGDF
jgi:hypothetical protein